MRRRDRKMVMPDQSTLKLMFKYDRDSGELYRLTGPSAGKAVPRVYMTLEHKNSFKTCEVIWALVYGEVPEKGVAYVNGEYGDNRLVNLKPWMSTSKRKVDGKHSKEYRCWRLIRARCYDKNNHNYTKYGAVGLTVCGRWLESFDNFLEDMGAAPTSDHSIDRINNSLGYSPENCRWATSKQQANNRKNNVIIKFNGEMKTVAEWARVLGIKPSTIYDRIRLGWPVERLLKVEIKGRKKVVYNGELIPIDKLSEKFAIPVRNLYRGLESGLTIEETVRRNLK